MDPIILASSSPRRQNILNSLRIPFQTIIPNIDESVGERMDIHDVPEFLARTKVSSVRKSLGLQKFVPWILGADTIVIHRNSIYGKPKSAEEALEFLKAFSGSKHIVKTAIALYNGKTGKISTRESITELQFCKLSDDELNWYVDTGEWHGAAGGYRIQGMASLFIKHISGSMSGVEGLPIFELYDILKEQGYLLTE
ncbi:MAG: septum formation protein Maf [Treponema sp.]|nr:septum formation protein Maf [Treponema sp.]